MTLHIRVIKKPAEPTNDHLTATAPKEEKKAAHRPKVSWDWFREMIWTHLNSGKAAPSIHEEAKILADLAIKDGIRESKNHPPKQKRIAERMTERMPSMAIARLEAEMLIAPSDWTQEGRKVTLWGQPLTGPDAYAMLNAMYKGESYLVTYFLSTYRNRIAA